MGAQAASVSRDWSSEHKSDEIAIDFHTDVQAGVLWRWRINVGDVRHWLIANFDPVSP